MGKRQHQKDKMYLTYTEWKSYGGYKPTNAEEENVKFKRLPFDHCCLSMVPFEHPYCDQEGNVYELQAILDFLQHFKINPISGKPMEAKSLIKLHFAKNHEDDYHCPTLFKPFTKNSHIVCVATTGNVFSWEAIEQLNLKTKNFKDLVDDTPFTRKDLITIQDPSNLEKFNISTFHHVRKNLHIETEEELLEKKNPQRRLKTINMETKEILSELERDYKPQETVAVEKLSADSVNAAHYSTGAVAAGFTSTTSDRVTVHEAAIVDEDELRYERVKKKGYVRMQTNMGPLNLELHCEMVPKTCENFLKLCAQGYYNNTKFHRSIRNFMIQGGDPTGTGMGGKSIWNEKFEDEFKPNLSHTGRGILSMANSGPNSNGSQFFITFRSCRSLDGKHTVFGKLVGGAETLTELEKIEVDNKDRPIEDIVIQKVHVFVDPYEEVDEQLAKERAEAAALKASEEKALAGTSAADKKKKEATKLTVFREGVGKYLNKGALKSDLKSLPSSSSGSGGAGSVEEGTSGGSAKKQKRYDFGGFTSW